MSSSWSCSCRRIPPERVRPVIPPIEVVPWSDNRFTRDTLARTRRFSPPCRNLYHHHLVVVACWRTARWHLNHPCRVSWHGETDVLDLHTTQLTVINGVEWDSFGSFHDYLLLPKLILLIALPMRRRTTTTERRTEVVGSSSSGQYYSCLGRTTDSGHLLERRSTKMPWRRRTTKILHGRPQ